MTEKYKKSKEPHLVECTSNCLRLRGVRQAPLDYLRHGGIDETVPAEHEATVLGIEPYVNLLLPEGTNLWAN